MIVTLLVGVMILLLPYTSNDDGTWGQKETDRRIGRQKKVPLSEAELDGKESGEKCNKYSKKQKVYNQIEPAEGSVM